MPGFIATFESGRHPQARAGRNATGGRVMITLDGRSPGTTAVDCMLDSTYSTDNLQLKFGDRLTLVGRCAGSKSPKA